jgi:hypothetical protein
MTLAFLANTAWCPMLAGLDTIRIIHFVLIVPNVVFRDIWHAL